MIRDALGLEVSNASERAIVAIDKFAFDLLSLGGDAAAVKAAADAEPECAMLQAYAALLDVSSQSRANALKGLPLIARARKHLAQLTERERLFIDAVAAGCESDFEGALARYEKIASKWPTDTVAAKMAEFHFFETGDAARQLRFMSGIESANRDMPHMQAMYGFALELNAQRKEAEAVAQRALDLDANTMWAQHCLGHVYSGDCRVDQGIASMERFAPSWNGFGRYIQAHNWFHLGALYLFNLDYARALEAFRNHVWGFTPDLVVEQTDAILLLWYLELAGGGVERDAWKAIAPHVQRGAFEHVFPFLNAIYIYALGRGGETATARGALTELERFARSQSGNAAHVWLNIGLPQAQASLAFAEGDWRRTAQLFEPILADVACGGGSDEQRGVFSQSYRVSLIRSGERLRAAAMLRESIGTRAPLPLEQLWLSQV